MLRGTITCVRAACLSGAGVRPVQRRLVAAFVQSAQRFSTQIPTYTDVDVDAHRVQRAARPTFQSKDGKPRIFRQRVLVENLPAYYSWQNLKDLMKTVGTVRSANVGPGPDGSVVGDVLFLNNEDSSEAISRFNGHSVEGSVLTVRLEKRVPTHKVSKGAGYRLYVGSLAWEVAWQDLKDHFKTIGPVARADVAVESSGRSRGFGFIEFVERADAARAIAELNGTMLRGRRISVQEDREGVTQD